MSSWGRLSNGKTGLPCHMYIPLITSSTENVHRFSFSSRKEQSDPSQPTGQYSHCPITDKTSATLCNIHRYPEYIFKQNHKQTNKNKKQASKQEGYGLITDSINAHRQPRTIITVCPLARLKAAKGEKKASQNLADNMRLANNKFVYSLLLLVRSEHRSTPAQTLKSCSSRHFRRYLTTLSTRVTISLPGTK